MRNHNRYYPMTYQNCCFDSTLELTWFLFLGELEITRRNLSSKPFSNNDSIYCYPDFRFLLSDTNPTDVFAQVKPIPKSAFDSKSTLDDEIFGDSVICLLGESNLDYQLLKVNLKLTGILNRHFKANTNLWQSCCQKAMAIERNDEQAHQAGLVQNNQQAAFGSDKGVSPGKITDKDSGY